jgi:hypothetical protein
VENDSSPSPTPGSNRSGPLAILGSPAAKLVWVVAVAAGIIGAVYFASRLELTESDRTVADTPPAKALSPDAPLTEAAGDSIILPEQLPGFETAALTNKQRLWLFHKANLEQCACDCGMTVAECRVDDPTCPVSPGRAVELVEEAARIDG